MLRVESRAVGDDATADARLETLLQQYSGFLRRTIRKVCPHELALSVDDIEQEAVISLWKALKNETNILYPTSYIYKVAVSAARRAVHRARALREESLDEEREDTPAPVHSLPAPSAASPHTAAERRDCRQAIESALARLSENRRLAVALHLKGLTSQEIGKLLQWSEPKARNLVHRGLKDMRALLRARGVEYSQ